MQRLAVVACLIIAIAVAIGAWQSSLSLERQKKATFKSMVVEPAAKSRSMPGEPEFDAARPRDSSSALEPSIAISDNSAITTTVPKLEFEPARIEFKAAFRLMKEGAWNEALANLQTLESDERLELQPTLSLLRIEALIQKRDTSSMELARQLLMDCKCTEHEILYELLVARWLLLGSPADRNRFLSEVASLPESARGRMSTWAHIRNGSKDPITPELLQGSASKGPSSVCDLLFLASFNYNVGKPEETVRELLDTQQQLLALEPSQMNEVESWLLESSKKQLSSKVDEILKMISQQSSKQFN